MDKDQIVGGTRVFLFLRPTTTQPTPYDWKSIVSTLQGNGVKIMEDCSGAPIGHHESGVILSGVVADYARTPQLINTLRNQGLGLAIYPWVSPSQFFDALSQVPTSTTTSTR